MPPVATTKISLQPPRTAPPTDTDLFPLETPEGVTGGINWALMKAGISGLASLERERYINQTALEIPDKSYQSAQNAINALVSGAYVITLAPGDHALAASPVLNSSNIELVLRGAGTVPIAPGMNTGSSLTAVSNLAINGGAVSPLALLTGLGSNKVTLQDLRISMTSAGAATTLLAGHSAYKRVHVKRCLLTWATACHLIESQALQQVMDYYNDPVVFEDAYFADLTVGAAPFEVPVGTCNSSPNLTIFRRCHFAEMSWSFPVNFYYAHKTVVFEQCYIRLSAIAAFLAFPAFLGPGLRVIFRDCRFDGTGRDIATASTAFQVIEWQGENHNVAANNIGALIVQDGIPLEPNLFESINPPWWESPAPTTRDEAIDRLAYALQGLLAGPVPILPAELITGDGDQLITGDGDQIIAP